MDELKNRVQFHKLNLTDEKLSMLTKRDSRAILNELLYLQREFVNLKKGA